MKCLILSLISSISFGILAFGQQPPPVGTLSENVQFALLDGGLTNAELTDYAGQIVVLYYYTPW